MFTRCSYAWIWRRTPHFVAFWGLIVLVAGVCPAQQPVDSGKCVVVELFTRDDCPRCVEAAAFLDVLHERHPRTRLVKWNLDRDPQAALRLKQIGDAFKVRDPAVPSFYLFRRLIGQFDGAETTGRQIEDLFTIDVYWREGCPRCTAGKRYFATLLAKYPVFRVRYREIARDASARREYEELSRRFGVRAPAVPTFHIGGQIVVGYFDDASTGRRLEELMTGGLGVCQPPLPTRSGRASSISGTFNIDDQLPLPSDAPADEISEFDLPLPAPLESQPSMEEGIELPFFGRLSVSEIGLLAFTLAIGLVDGFNPCAMWVLLFLLSILVNLHDRKKIVVVAGTFVVVSGLVYLAFMAAWLNVFLLIGYMRPAQIVLGLVAVVVGLINIKDFFAFKWGVSLSIPESAKPGIYARVRNIVNAKYLWVALTGAMVLALFVNAVELLCSAGFPAMYTEILSLQQLPLWQNYAYLGLYIAAYMFDDTVMLLIVVITLTKTKLQETGGRWLKLISGAVIFALGLAMLFRPNLLA